MYKNKKILALITARGGSKGLPGKNIRNLAGKPLISWTIKQALASPIIDRIIVSTDDNRIAAVAKKYGAEVPFMRPKVLASSSAKSVDVAIHALNWLERYNNDKYDIVILLQPTSPLRTAEDIRRAFQLFFAKNAKAVVSVCTCEHSPLWSNRLPSDLNMGKFIKASILNKNRQSLGQYYRLNGAVYIAETRYLREKRSFFGRRTYAYIMDTVRSVDIDSIIDFTLAEILMKQRRNIKR